MFKVYILYSEVLGKYYTGYTGNLEQRLTFHNEGKNSFSNKGVPWKLVVAFDAEDKTSAMRLEKQIKKNGAKRYLARNGIFVS
jgi:putative endonuclease